MTLTPTQIHTRPPASLVAAVRQAMRLLGLAVVERPIPDVTIGDENAYHPGDKG